MGLLKQVPTLPPRAEMLRPTEVGESANAATASSASSGASSAASSAPVSPLTPTSESSSTSNSSPSAMETATAAASAAAATISSSSAAAAAEAESSTAAAESSSAALSKAESSKIEKVAIISSVIVDCGTGETKAMLWRYFHVKGSQKFVSVEQVSNKLNPVTDFLAGDVVPATWAFLEGYEPEEGECLRPQHLLAFLEKICKDAGAVEIAIGVSAWFRQSHRNSDESSKERRQYEAASRLIGELQAKGIRCLCLHEQQEGYFEASSVAYAFARATDSTAIPSACLSGGSGSSQYAQGMEHFFGIDRGNKKLAKMMETKFKQHGNFDEAFKQLDAAADGSPDCEIAQHITDTKVQYARSLPKAQRKQFLARSKGDVMAIAACYFAACEVGLQSADGDITFVDARHVVERMGAKEQELRHMLVQYLKDPGKNPLPPGRKGAKGTPKDLFRPIANLALHRTMYSALFDLENTRICFKRNWVINGKEKYRTTWTGGYFLDYLNRVHNVTFPGSDAILQKYNHWKEHSPDLQNFSEAVAPVDRQSPEPS